MIRFLAEIQISLKTTTTNNTCIHIRSNMLIFFFHSSFLTAHINTHTHIKMMSWHSALLSILVMVSFFLCSVIYRANRLLLVSLKNSCVLRNTSLDQTRHVLPPSHFLQPRKTNHMQQHIRTYSWQTHTLLRLKPPPRLLYLYQK